MSSSAVLYKNATVVSMDPSIGIKNNCDVLIEGRVISKVEPNITAPANAEVIDAGSSIICPGFLDLHHHMWQQLLRTVATDWSLIDYFTVIRHCYGSLFTPEDVYCSNYTACLDLFNHGVTTVVDHCHILNSPAHADAAIKALKDSHIRGVFCYGLYDNPPLAEQHAKIDTVNPSFTGKVKQDDARRARNEHFTKDNKWENNLLTFGLAPNELEVMPWEQLKQEIDFGRSLDSTIVTGHVGLGRYDMGLELVQQMAEKNYLGSDLLFSHGAAWTNAECDAIAKFKSGVASTPDTDLQMGMGMSVAFRARDHGCRVGLGIDVVCNQGNDFIQQGRLVLQAERMLNNEKGDIPVEIKRKTEEVLRMMTLGGAEALGIDHLTGSLTPGKRADIVVIKCDELNTVPFSNPVGLIIMNSNPANISDVLVDGRFVKKDGKVVAISEKRTWEKLRSEINERGGRLVADAEKVTPKASIKGINEQLLGWWKDMAAKSKM
jgi:cytosine/adenosine deaminase-related metal-dependent hydrolase